MVKHLYIILLLLSFNCAAQISYYESDDYSGTEPDKAFISINEKYNSAILRLRFNYNFPSETTHKVNYVQFDCHALRRDSLLVFILGNFQYESQAGEFISSYADFSDNQGDVLCPYIVTIQQNDSMIIQYVSNSLGSFLEHNKIVNKSMFNNIFPGLYTQTKELPKAFLPKQLRDDKNYKKETKRIKKKLALEFRCISP